MEESAVQSRVVVIATGLLRRADELVDDPVTSYGSFSELVAMALRNQLELDPLVRGDRKQTMPSRPAYAMAGGAAHIAADFEGHPLLTPPAAPAFDAAEAVEPGTMRPLGFLTNRINPIPIVARGLANLGPVGIKRAYEEIGSLARLVGLHLQRRDKSEGRPMSTRLATSWPVGDGVEKSAAKFVASYMVDGDGGGPLHDLGLARLVEGNLSLTSRGCELAASPIPLIGEETGTSTVGGEARRILTDAVVENPNEHAVIAAFLLAVEEQGGRQSAVDDALKARFGWQSGVAVSNRAALLGRLKDLDVVVVSGRGADATIELTEPGRDLLERTGDAVNAAPASGEGS